MVNSTLCYLERSGAYLMLHRVKKRHDLNQGKWIGIGGKCEEGESPEDCLLRECREETGLSLTAYRCRGLVTFVSDQAPTEYMHLFTATGWTGTMCQCQEGDLAWVEKERIGDLCLWAGDRIFLELLERDVPYFSLKLQYQGDSLVQAVLDGKPLADKEGAYERKTAALRI